MLLTEILYILITALSVYFLVRIVGKPELIYEYPFIMSFGFVVFIFPQVFVIYEKHILKTDSVNRLFLMTLLCWVLSFWGWYIAKPTRPPLKRIFQGPVNEDKLGLVGMAFVVLGCLFNYSASRIIKSEEFANQQATGIVTIFIFFQQLLFLGTGLCLTLYLKNRKQLLLMFAILGGMFGFYIGIFQGRRTQTLYTLMVIGVPLFLGLNLKPARSLVIAGILAAFLIIPSIGQYRKIMSSSKDAKEFFNRLGKEMDFQKNLEEFYMSAKSYELVNAGYMIDHAYKTSEYHFGSSYWNQLVFRFIPAQIVGKETKAALMIPEKNADNRFNPNYVLGSTTTGIGDAFHQFDFFGSAFFFLVGLLMRSIWATVRRGFNPFYQVLYSVVLIECLVSLTHGTIWFLPGLISAFVFLYLAYRYSKVNSYS